jgi:uncharacterized protein
VEGILPVLIYSAIAIAAFIILYAFIIAALSYLRMIHIKRHKVDWITQTCREKGELSDWMYDAPWEREDIDTPDSYKIAAFFLPGSLQDRVVVFHHGVKWNRFGMFRYMEPFRKRGWNIACLDSRGHGDSGGGNPTFGYYEKRDLGLVVARARKRFTQASKVVLFGESMGAATVLQYAPLDPELSAVVADCPYSGADCELSHGLKKSFVPGLLRPVIMWIFDLFCRLFDRFSIFQASPRDAILKTNVPIIFFHGTGDDFVPWRMSVAMYESRKGRAPTQLELFEGATHGRSRATDIECYDSLVFEFLDQAFTSSVLSKDGYHAAPALQVR